MKILVLGATGMAGHTIALYLKEIGHDVTAFARRPFMYTHFIQGDVTDFDHLREVIIEHEFDAIINAVGMLNQDAEDHKVKAVLVNSALPHFLSEVTQSMKSKIIHMSTDCVFSGHRGGYQENDVKDGETFYDRSKALGEIDNNKDLTFRCSIIGPDLSESGIGLFNWFMKQDQAISGYTHAIWTGVTTLTLAKAMNRALEVNLCGLYHCVNNSTISKYDLLHGFNQGRKLPLMIQPNPNVVVDKSLINTRHDFDFVVPSYEDMIKEMYMWIKDHANLYPHYASKIG